MQHSPDVLVIGGGVAGLCAAVELSSRGWSVTLAEQKRHLGGRVYSFIDDETGDEVDNGQHLMLGCYHHTLRYLDAVGTRPLCSLQDTLSIRFRNAARSVEMRAPKLPAPLHMLGALATLRTLSAADRLSLLRAAPALLFARASSEAHLRSITVARWLDEIRQSDAAKRALWNILAVGTLNERPEEASAAVFVHVLRRVFLGARRDSSVLLPRCGLSRIFGDAGAEYVTAHRGCVLLQTPAAMIRIADSKIDSTAVGSETLRPKAVIAAVPPYALTRLFESGDRSRLPMLDHTERFMDVPIVSIHLWFDRHFMDEEFTALLDSPIDWVFNRAKITAKSAGPMQLSLVVSAARTLAAQTKDEIIAMAVREVHRAFPEAAGARLVHGLVVKEKRATFSPAVGMEAFRPAHATAVRNLFLAGDWTGTELPATIEGAAQSGYACADLAHAYLNRIA